MKLATIEQVQECIAIAPSDKPQAPGNKHRAFFNDPCFNHPDVWYKIWLQGILEYLKQRAARHQAPSVRHQARQIDARQFNPSESG
jgi:predicted lipoprotein